MQRFQIQCGYTPRHGSHSAIHSDLLFQIQYGYTPDTAVILLLIQTSTIRYRLETLQTRKPFYFSFRLNYQLQVQIHSRHVSHSVTYPDPSYSTDTFQTRKSFCYSYRSQLQIQSRYAPDTVAIL